MPDVLLAEQPASLLLDALPEVQRTCSPSSWLRCQAQTRIRFPKWKIALAHHVLVTSVARQSRHAGVTSSWYPKRRLLKIIRREVVEDFLAVNWG